MDDIKSLYKDGRNVSVLIQGKTTVNILGSHQNIDVLFERNGCRFMMLFSGLSELSLNAKDYLFGKNINIQFVDKNGQQYIAYECICLKSKMTMDYILLEGEYKTLLKGSCIPICGILEIRFDGIDFFMSNCELMTDNNLNKCNEWNLIEVDEKRKIIVKLNDINNFNVLHNLLVKVREYFDFIANHELIFDEIKYYDAHGEGIEILRSDKITSEKSFIFHEKTMLSTDVIFYDLNQWLSNYEKYKEPIYIWKKSIHNYNVSEEDVFLWRCQSFELLCELDDTIYTEALKLKDKRQKEPNLRNYLEALNQMHHYIDCEDEDLIDVKEVRNLYTHNNPQKLVSKRQWHNSMHIIQIALMEGIKYSFGMKNKECKGFYLHIAKGGMEETKKRFNI